MPLSLSAGVPVYAYEVSPQWPDGGGHRTSIGAGAVALLTAAAMAVWLTLYRVAGRLNEKNHGGEQIKLYAGGKSDPLSMSVAGVYALARECSRLGVLLLFSYMCEHYPLFPHSAKIHDMDMFWLVHLALFIASVWKLEKSKTTDLLNREQTEEWKGWMQFSFLMYHYFSAHETYNAIRVMITCYVWMTGFGNFSFFYIKRDFGFVRVAQMIWRLNFLVVLLMLVQGSSYMLYYICPLHTFYFVLTYVTMVTVQSVNHSKWGVRAKLFVVGLIIFATWEMDLGLFDLLFFYVGTDPAMGGTSGPRYEWYFRTSLDRWSTFLGMIFALNYPVSNRWLKEVCQLSFPRHLGAVGIPALVAIGAASWWYTTIFQLPKFEYNSYNAFFAPVPVLCYIFLRNAHPTLRQWYSPVLHTIGKTTLETYLMQHHIWLTSNAKTLLVIVPGMPKINFLLVTCGYYLIARELYRLTMSMRGMFLPDNKAACIRNLVWLTCSAFLLGGLSLACVVFIENLAVRLATFAALAVGLGLALVATLSNHSTELEGKSLLVPTYLTTIPRVAVVFVFAGLLALNAATRVDRPTVGRADLGLCVDSVNNGAWRSEFGLTSTDCYGQGGETALVNVAAHCSRASWTFNDTQCGFQMLSKKSVKSRLPRNPRIAVVGDSEARESYRALNKIFGKPNDFASKAHADITPLADEGAGVAFYWGPLAADVFTRIDFLRQMPSPPDMIIVSFGSWDALTVHDVDAFASQLAKVNQAIAGASKTLVVGVSAPTIVDDKLNSDDKRKYMNNAAMRSHNSKLRELLNVPLFVAFDKLTSPEFAKEHTLDGLTYAPMYYSVAIQQVLNAAPYAADAASLGWEEEYTKTRAVGGMYRPEYGAGMLVAVFLMLVTFDVYGGVLWLSGNIFGSADMLRNVQYNQAYRAVLLSIDPTLVEGGASQSPPQNPGKAASLPL